MNHSLNPKRKFDKINGVIRSSLVWASLLIAFSIFSSDLRAQWRVIQSGTSSYCAERNAESAIAISKSGTVYWAIRACDAKDKGIAIIEYNGSTWKKLPPAFNQQLKVWSYVLAVAPDESLYLAVRAGNWYDQTKVYKWDGTRWYITGTNNVGPQDRHHLILEMVFDANSNPILVTQDRTTSLFLDLTMYKLTNNNWNLIGKQSFNYHRIHRIQAIYLNKSSEVLINLNNHIGGKYHHYVLSFSELNKNFKQVFKYDTGNGDNIAIALDRNGDGRMVTYNVAHSITRLFTYTNGSFNMDAMALGGSGSYIVKGIGFDSSNDVFIEQFSGGIAMLHIKGQDYEMLRSDLKDVQYGRGALHEHPNGTFIMAAFDAKNYDAMMLEFDPLKVGIEVVKEQVISIYPNPAHTQIVIQPTSQLNAESLTIRSVNGSLVHQGILKQDAMTIDVSEWSKGVYIIEVGQLRRKFVVGF